MLDYNIRSFVSVLVLCECGIRDDDKCFLFAGKCKETNDIIRDVPDFGSGRSGIRPFIGSPAPVRIMAGFGPAVLGLFSTAGDIISDHRSRLLPENAETLIYLKFNGHLLEM